jgi:hypothetical protein
LVALKTPIAESFTYTDSALKSITSETRKAVSRALHGVDAAKETSGKVGLIVFSRSRARIRVPVAHPRFGGFNRSLLALCACVLLLVFFFVRSSREALSSFIKYRLLGCGKRHVIYLLLKRGFFFISHAEPKL